MATTGARKSASKKTAGRKRAVGSNNGRQNEEMGQRAQRAAGKGEEARGRRGTTGQGNGGAGRSGGRGRSSGNR